MENLAKSLTQLGHITADLSDLLCIEKVFNVDHVEKLHDAGWIGAVLRDFKLLVIGYILV